MVSGTLWLALAGGAGACGGQSTAHKPTTTAGTRSVITTAPTTAAPTTAAPTTVPATTVAPAPVTAAPNPQPVAGGGYAIGDSVLEDVKLYASRTMTNRGIAINAAVSRQWGAGISILSSLKAAGKLPPVVVVALGSNGQVNATQFDQMMQVCAGARRVVFMTVTGPLIGNNPVIRAGVARFPKAVLVDWNTAAASHPEWFAPDKVHVGPAGAFALGNLLAGAA